MAPRKSRTLTEREEIQSWAEERGGRPAGVEPNRGEDVSIIGLLFPGMASGDESLNEISWDDWFESFEGGNLALIVEDAMAGGQSNIHKLVSRRATRGRARRAGVQGRPGASARKASTRRATVGRRGKTGAIQRGRGRTRTAAGRGAKRGAGRARPTATKGRVTARKRSATRRGRTSTRGR